VWSAKGVQKLNDNYIGTLAITFDLDASEKKDDLGKRYKQVGNSAKSGRR
jgi:hypothetical protein